MPDVRPRPRRVASMVDRVGCAHYGGPVNSAPRQSNEWKSVADYLFAGEALAYLCLARLAVPLVPFRWITGWMSKPVGTTRAVDPHRIVRAVERAARAMPGRTVCIHRGIALQRMLRRRGHASQFAYGLSSSVERFVAHVWIEMDGERLIGGDEAEGFQRVAMFPARASDDQPLNRVD